MLHLALAEQGRSVMAREIAEEQNLPLTYLEQLMLALKKAGLVMAIRGAHGGYMLARDASAITLAQIVESLEGPLHVADCADVPNCCKDPHVCALKDIFSEWNAALYEAFDRITLADFASRHRLKLSASNPMYFI